MKNKVLFASILAAVLVTVCVGVSGLAKLSVQTGVVLLEPKNTVNFRGVVDEVSTTKAILEIARLDTLRGKQDYPIYLVMDSPGGSIQAGLSFIEYAKGIRNLKTISIFAASMGSAIVEQLPGERLVLESGVLMFHRASGSFKGQFNDGEVESQLAFWKSVVQSLEQKNADRMSMDIEVYKNKVRDELWIYGADNVAQKSADRVISIQCSEALMKETEMISVQILIFDINAEFSKCPLLTQPLSVEEEQGE